jgi:hypothetical protein
MEKRFFGLNDVNFICIGTDEIKMWATEDAKPFVILLNTEEDFDANGLDYEDYADMKVSETRNDGMYEGIIVIRIK